MRRPVMPVWIPIFCLALLGCSDSEQPLEPQAITWDLHTITGTAVNTPFVLVEIMVTATPADTAYLHITVESKDFAPVDFLQLQLPERPGEGTETVRILGKIPIWTDWRMVVAAWSQHSDVVADTTFWNGVPDQEPAGPAGELRFQVAS